jgi:hypothetical protein
MGSQPKTPAGYEPGVDRVQKFSSRRQPPIRYNKNKQKPSILSMKLLKSEYGVTHGFANTIVLLYRQQAAGGPPAEEDLVAAQYQGPKAALRPIYDAVLEAVSGFGTDVEIAPKKTYVSLRRGKQFAIVQANTRTRVDLGLNLKGTEPTDRLEGGSVFSGMCTHRVRLSEPAGVDDQVRSWLHQAYEQA